MLAITISEQSPEKKPLGTLYQKAVFAYESQISNPLLKVWENAIAGMAEGKERGLIKTLILNSTCRTIDEIIQKTYPIKAGMVESFIHLLENKLISAIQLQYDPVIHKNAIANDQRSIESAFVLYDKSTSFNFSEWMRIDTPAAFQAFLARKVEEVISDLGEKKNNNLQKLFLKQIHRILLESLHSNEFLETLLKHYHPENANIEHPLQQLSSLQYTPWTTMTGNDSKNVFNVYMETSLNNPTMRFAPNSAKALLARIINIARETGSNNNPTHANILIPARILSLHTFLLMPDHPSLVHALKYKGGDESWIDEHVIDPGKQVSDTFIDMKTRLVLIVYAYQNLLPRDKILEFIKEVSNAPELISIKNFRNFVLKSLNDFVPADDFVKVARARQLDTLLCQNMPEALRKKIETSAVHFADTNWAEGIHDIHFCFAVNPGTGELELWEVYDNGTTLSALDQNKWLLNKEWEIFIN